VTAVYVTHDQAEAMGLSDRIVVMWEGRSFKSLVAGLYEQPRCRVAAIPRTHQRVRGRLTDKGSPLAHAAIDRNAIRLDAASRGIPRPMQSESVDPTGGVSVHSASARGGDVSGRVASTSYLATLAASYKA